MSGHGSQQENARKRKRDDGTSSPVPNSQVGNNGDAISAAKRSTGLDGASQAASTAPAAAAPSSAKANLDRIKMMLAKKKEEVAVAKDKLQQELEAKEAAQKENELRQKALLTANLQPAVKVPPPKPVAAAFSSDFDEPIAKPVSTLKANVRHQAELAEKKQIAAIREQKAAAPVAPRERAPLDPLFDPRMSRDKAQRKRRALNFVEPGTYIKQAEEMNQYIASLPPSKKEGASDAMEIDEPKKKKEKVIIPVVEWWDAPWIEGENYDIILDDKINNLIDHPVLLEPPAEKQGGGPLPLMLTPAERKRLKKQMKAEQMKEMQDKVLLGLATPPGPRVRISNMVRVLGAEAILDPTSIEKAVRKEMAARERRHEERNAERKLTPEQRKEKKIAKLKEDTSLQSIVAVFKVNSVADPRLRFKVDINAQQNYLTGCCVTSPSFSLIVVEGGPKAIRKYKKLMMRRVNWNIKPEGQEDDDDEDDPKAGPNNCHIVWEGEVLRPTFRNFRFEAYPNEAAARKWLQDSGVAHYWDMAEKVGTGSI